MTLSPVCHNTRPAGALPEQEAAVRRDEILRAVYAVNGPREEPPPFVPVG